MKTQPINTKTKHLTKAEKMKLTPAQKKEIKAAKRKITANKFNTVTLVLQIIITIGLLCVALAPVLSVLFGIGLLMFVVVGVIITTAATLGIAWTSEPFRNFWKKTWDLLNNVMDPQKIVDALKDKIIWLTIVIFIASSVGFIYNLIYYIKNKTNKKRFITSCVFLGIALIAVILGIVLYLTYKK